jgi:NADH-quinone oxidoreductase subunit E
LTDQYGYIPKDALIDAATLFGISVAEAFGIATFYSMFTLEPSGKNIIRVCHSAPCYTTGCEDIVDRFSNELGIKVGDTTSDGLFKLEHSECVGQCQAAPACSINGKPYTAITKNTIAEVLAEHGNQSKNWRA